MRREQICRVRMNGVGQGAHSCPNRALIARKKIEDSVVDALAKTLSQHSWLSLLAKRIEEKRAEAQGLGPKNRAAIKKELERLDREIDHLVAFIAKGNLHDSVASSLAERERRRKLLESGLRKLADIESHKAGITPQSLRPQLERLIGRIRENPSAARVAMRKLFPGGIKLTPPKDRAKGPWRADLALDGGNVVFLETHRAGNAANSSPRNSKPPEDSEGCEFSESALCSG